MTSIPILHGVRELVARFPVWLCDIWGVLHNGEVSYREASDALVRHRKGGGIVVLITNAPRPFQSIVEQITTLGIPPAAYDAMVTSGDVTRALIQEQSGRGIFHLGPPKDLPLFAGLDADLVGLEAAAAVVCTGLMDDTTETPDTYAGLLAEMRSRGLPMICANPDLIVERGASLCYCAGALGQAYQAIGGAVAYAGKPKAPIYREAVKAAAAARRADPVPRSAVLAIGDGLKTDILGAHNFGIDSLFVASGIHVGGEAGLTDAMLAELFHGHAARPVAAIERLVW